MKYSLLVTLALALTAAAMPQRGGGRGGRGGGKGGNNNNNGANASSSAAAAAASASASAGASASVSAGASASASVTATAAGTVNTASSATPNNPDLQNSLTLDPSVIATGFQNDGQAQPAAGQVPSLTSSNNFINFCATSQLPLTNGKQVAAGSCNGAPMGLIPSVDNMPSAKFTFPANGGTIAANKAFTISVAVNNFETGHFVNAQQNYFAAPQQLNAQGQIQGHSHVVVETLDSLTQATPTDPKKFAFFKGLNAAAVNGVLTADVANGLPVGVYKVSTINTAANHQPVLLPVAQHGSPEDVVYFTVTADGTPAAGANNNNASSAAAAASATAGGNASSASSAAAGASATAGGNASSASSAAAGASATAGGNASSASSAAAQVSATTGAQRNKKKGGN